MLQECVTKREEFSRKMIDILNHGAINLALALGYRTGLFEVMASLNRPESAAAIAGAAGLDERYVSEWLGVMVTGRIVELAPEDGRAPRYFLPPEHAAFLIRKSEDTNLGVYTQEIPLLTTLAFESVLRGFTTGEGVPYTCYPRFQAFMTELSNAKHSEVLVNRFLPSVDGGRLVPRLQQGIRVGDLGCGEGVAVSLMARAFPHSRFVGIDLAEEAIQTARQGAARQGLTNAEFIVRDAATLEDDPAMADRFDYITAFDAVHDQTAPLAALRGVHHMLAPDGLFSMVDIAAESAHRGNLDHPLGPFLYTVSLLHCLPVGLVNQGTGLGMMWGRDRAVAMLREAGFEHIRVAAMEDDPFNDHYLCRK